MTRLFSKVSLKKLHVLQKYLMLIIILTWISLSWIAFEESNISISLKTKLKKNLKAYFHAVMLLYAWTVSSFYNSLQSKMINFITAFIDSLEYFKLYTLNPWEHLPLNIKSNEIFFKKYLSVGTFSSDN